MFSIYFFNKLPYLNGFNKEFHKIGCFRKMLSKKNKKNAIQFITIIVVKMF